MKNPLLFIAQKATNFYIFYFYPILPDLLKKFMQNRIKIKLKPLLQRLCIMEKFKNLKFIVKNRISLT